MFAPECPRMFDKRRPFLGDFLGAPRVLLVCNDVRFIGFGWYNVTARSAVTLPRKEPIP